MSSVFGRTVSAIKQVSSQFAKPEPHSVSQVHGIMKSPMNIYTYIHMQNTCIFLCTHMWWAFKIIQNNDECIRIKDGRELNKRIDR